MNKLINISIITLFFFNMTGAPNFADKINNKFDAKYQVEKNHLASPQNKTILSKIVTSMKQPGNLIKECGKDVTLACLISTGILLLHECGHAIAAKLLYGSPIDINLFVSPSTAKQKPRLQIGGIKIIGSSFSGYSSLKNYPKNYSPLKKDIFDFIIYSTGPVFGVFSGLATHILLRRNKGLYTSKAISIALVFDQIAGSTGLLGIWNKDPLSDGAIAVNSLKNILKTLK